MKIYGIAVSGVVIAIVAYSLDSALVAIGGVLITILALAIDVVSSIRRGQWKVRPLSSSELTDDFERRTSMTHSLQLDNNWHEE